MVAMRVVNNVEREMMRAEWENWLLDENARCKQAQIILRENRTISSNRKTKGATSQQVIEDREKAHRLESLRQWHEEYCGSCKLEQDMLLKGQKHLTFG
jgi:hypothetical protein